MMFQSLASSSHGNAYFVSDGMTVLLLECGITHSRLRKAAGFHLSEVAACLVSHEHKDHAQAVKQLQKDGIPVYLSAGTAEALELEDAELVEDRQQITIGTIDIVPFATYHDAREPLGFLLKSRMEDGCLVFATDTCNLAYRFPGAEIIAIEANYDEGTLDRTERIPDKVKTRIKHSHMEIHRLCEYLKTLDLTACKKIYLLHLGDATSNEAGFIRMVERAVDADRRGIEVIACKRE